MRFGCCAYTILIKHQNLIKGKISLKNKGQFMSLLVSFFYNVDNTRERYIFSLTWGWNV